MEDVKFSGYHNIQRSKIIQIKHIFSNITFRDKTIKPRIIELWIGLEIKANFANSKKPYFVNGAEIYLNKGQLAICKKTYSQDRKISISVFNRILATLEKHDLIKQNTISGVKGHSVITIINYSNSKNFSRNLNDSKSELITDNSQPFYGPKNGEKTGKSRDICDRKNFKAESEEFEKPQSKELLNKTTNKKNINNTTNELSSCEKINLLISTFKQKLPNAKIYIEKLKDHFLYSSLSFKDILIRIDNISNSPVLTYLCKSINFVFTLENKDSIGYKKEIEYLMYVNNKLKLQNNQKDFDEKLKEIYLYLKCSKDTLISYLKSKNILTNVVKKDSLADESASIAISGDDDLTQQNKINLDNPSDRKPPIDFKPEEHLNKKRTNNLRNAQFRRRDIEKNLLDLSNKKPEKKNRIEEFLNLYNLTGYFSPALKCSYQNIIAI